MHAVVAGPTETQVLRLRAASFAQDDNFGGGLVAGEEDVDGGVGEGEEGTEGGGNIASLTLEHYPEMAEAEIMRHAETAMSRWPLLGLTVIHRVGRIHPGENIVLVVTASQHRQAAFQAAEFLMDYLKTSAPFWKREEGSAGAAWVEARSNDDAAAARWTKS